MIYLTFCSLLGAEGELVHLKQLEAQEILGTEEIGRANTWEEVTGLHQPSSKTNISFEHPFPKLI